MKFMTIGPKLGVHWHISLVIQPESKDFKKKVFHPTNESSGKRKRQELPHWTFKREKERYISVF